MKNNDYYLSSNMKYLRLINNKVLKELTPFFGVTESAISLYEKGTREPTIETLIKIACYYNISIDDLLTKDLRFNSKKERLKTNVKLDDNHKLDLAIQDKSKELSDEDKQILINIMDNIEKLSKK